MGLFKRAHVRGIAHELTRQGVVTWPSKEAEEMAVDEIADDMSDEDMPEVSGEEGLSPEQASGALSQIVDVAQALAAKTGNARDEGVNKTAASLTYEDAASQAATSLMQKAAEEQKKAEETAVATGPDVPGTTAPTPDLGATAEAKIDATKVPSSGIVGPKGTTEIDTKPGAIGQESRRPDQPGGEASAPTGEVAKTAEPLLKTLESMLTKMAAAEEKKKEEEKPAGEKLPPFMTKKKDGDKKDDDDEEKKKKDEEAKKEGSIKEAMDGASLSGGTAAGPAPTPRLDLDDNLLIPGVVAASQGQTSQSVPPSANIGATMAQPAGTPGVTAPTPNKPAMDARIKSAMDVLNQSEEGRQLLHKLSQHAAYSQQAEAQKGAVFGQALQGLAKAITQ